MFGPFWCPEGHPGLYVDKLMFLVLILTAFWPLGDPSGQLFGAILDVFSLLVCGPVAEMHFDTFLGGFGIIFERILR